MAGRSRHGMHVVTGDVEPLPQPITSHLSRAGQRDSVSLQELVLDLSEVSDVDDDGMAPIVEAEEVLALRSASLRLEPVPAQVTRFLGGPRGDRHPDQES